MRSGIAGAAAVAVLAVGQVAQATPPACKCVNDAAVCVPYSDKAACVYLMNVFAPDLASFQNYQVTESELVGKVVNDPNNRARFFQVGKNQTEDGRVSTDGVLVVRGYDATHQPLPLSEIAGLGIQVNGTPQVLLPQSDSAVTKVVYLKDALANATLGDAVSVDVTTDGAVRNTRYSWYRPRNGWAVDYTLAAFAFVWPGWKFNGVPEKSIAPAMIDLEYRYYHQSGYFYLFPGISIGPNFVLSDAKDTSGKNASGADLVNGLLGAAFVNVNGVTIGFGSRWAWSEKRFDPMITLSITEVVGRGLGIADKYPSALLGSNK